MGPLALLLLLPLAGFVVNGVAGSRLPKRVVALVACGLPVVAFLLAAALFRQVAGTGVPLAETLYPWVAIPGFDVGVALHFDQLTAVMCLVVTGIGALIHVYSVGYMADDRGFARYFAYLNLFLFFMLVLVLGRNLVVMFVGWEGVGLASYLLIGFWFDDDAKTAAGLKAFIVNRVGDTGFVLAAFLLYLTVGSLDFQVVNAFFSAHPPATATTTTIALLLLLGVCGKSAQIPLHVWLPDAMAGPTPVSALIHAATMVTAGVYLLARMNGVYLQAPAAMEVVAWVGAATALLGATMGVTQFNLKKVLAYSTISQLGLMVMACGLGAFSAGMFHLVTHAFFKACLFLGAGAVLHALHGEEDMRRMGGLAGKMPFTFATFLIATLALCGIPPLAGFFSKDEILWQAWLSADGVPWLWLVGIVTSALTGYYMVRAVCLAFLAPVQRSNAGAPAPHDPPLSMRSVLAVLALGSIVVGFIGMPGVLRDLAGMRAPFHDFLAPIVAHAEAQPGAHAAELILMAVAVLVASAGMLAAWRRYRRGHAGARSEAPGALRSLVEQGYGFDRLYDGVIVRSVDWVSASVLARGVEVGLAKLSLAAPAATARFASMLFTRLQSGNVQAYALYALAGLALVLAWVATHA